MSSKRKKPPRSSGKHKLQLLIDYRLLNLAVQWLSNTPGILYKRRRPEPCYENDVGTTAHIFFSERYFTSLRTSFSKIRQQETKESFKVSLSMIFGQIP